MSYPHNVLTPLPSTVRMLRVSPSNAGAPHGGRPVRVRIRRRLGAPDARSDGEVHDGGRRGRLRERRRHLDGHHGW